MTKREFSDYFKTGLFSLFLVVLPLIYGSCLHFFRNEVIYCGTLLFLCVFVIMGQARKGNRALDYAIILFLLGSILDIIFIKNGEFDRFIIYKWTAVAVCYFVVNPHCSFALKKL